MRKCNDGAGIGVSSDGDIGSVSSIPSNSRQSGNQVNGRADCKIDMALSALGLITVLARSGRPSVAGLPGRRLARLLRGEEVHGPSGWRYLDVNYRTNPSRLFVYHADPSGAPPGVTISLK